MVEAEILAPMVAVSHSKSCLNKVPPEEEDAWNKVEEQIGELLLLVVEIL